MSNKVLIYEDNDSLRQSISTLLSFSKDMEIACVFEDANNVVNDVTTHMPDVIIMDIDMPQSNGVDAVISLRAKNINTAIIMFTVFEDDDNVFNALCAGANGYILKKNIDQISAAITDVLNGGAPMTSSIARKVLNRMAQKPQNNKLDAAGLTTREREILEYIVKGYSYKMIGNELFIAPDTVRTHIKNIYKKLQVNSATEAAYVYHQKI
jgi:DNA-binding NarL/FixJ family response regulator